MCNPEIDKYVANQLSRRDFLALGGLMVAATALVGTVSSARAATQRALSYSRIIDLSHTLSPQFPMWPNTPPMNINTQATVEKDGYYGSRIEYWEHSGTHLDAPAHFIAKGKSADQLPAQDLLVPVVVCDIRDTVQKNPDAAVEIDDLVAWEKKYGRLPDGALVMMFSGWDTRVQNPKAYLNQDTSGTMHFPGFSHAASEFLVAERKISGIGVDTLSLDIGAASAFKTHVNVLGAGKYGLENVANLGLLPPKGATLMVGIPKMERASGGPVRLLALV